jgi:hypothetical protein
MIRSITASMICCYFLLGSIILPLGDFSLMKELPKMYQAYEKLAAPDERCIADFVGDYLMGGRTMLGHNKNDAPETSKSNIQYQHTATFSIVFNVRFQLSSVMIADVFLTHSLTVIPFNTTEFHEELFRPPLTTLS